MRNKNSVYHEELSQTIESLNKPESRIIGHVILSPKFDTIESSHLELDTTPS